MTDREANLPEPDLLDGVMLDFRGQYVGAKNGYSKETVIRLLNEAVMAERYECQRLCLWHMYRGERELLAGYIEAASNCARDINNRSAA